MDSNDLAKDISKFKLTGPLVEPILWSSRSRPDTPPGQDKDNASGGGNVECSEVGDYASSSGRNNYNDGEFDNLWPEDFKVGSDGETLIWEFIGEIPEGTCLKLAVIVKGGPDANVYFYDGQTSDDGLTAPINPNNGKPYGISNVTLCWDFEEIPEEPEVEGGAECFDEDLKLTAKVTSEIPDGIIIKWYDQEVGGVPI
jgi:hypothetical protein